MPERRPIPPEKGRSGQDDALAGQIEGRDPAYEESDPLKKVRVAPKKVCAGQISLADPLDDASDLLDDVADPLDGAAERRIAGLSGAFALFGGQVAAFFWWVEVSVRPDETFFHRARPLTLWVGGFIQWVSRLVQWVSLVVQ